MFPILSSKGRIYGAAKEDDPADPATWIKANPSLKQNGGFLDIEKIREKYVSHEAEGDLTSFKRYYLNMWDQKESRPIDMVKWDASAGDWQAAGLLTKPPGDKVRPLSPALMSRFKERRCWAGVDLSMTTDLSAVSIVFPCADSGFDVLAFFWMPEQAVRQRERRDGMPYQQWAEQGFIELSSGDVIDYRDIVARLEWASQMFDLEEICFDPWNSRQISVPMTEQGHACIEIRQGVATLSEPSKKLLELVAGGKLHHGGHPVLRWNASCLSTKESNDNLIFTKPERSKSSSRIDGIAATVNALARAIVKKPDEHLQHSRHPDTPGPMEIDRCRHEIATIEALIRAGHPDLEGLCLALSDWRAELRLIEQEMALKAKMPAAAEAGRAEGREGEATS